MSTEEARQTNEDERVQMSSTYMDAYFHNFLGFVHPRIFPVLPIIEKRLYHLPCSQNNCTKISGLNGNSATRDEVYLGGVRPSWPA
jgi:hypothetical protein